MDKYLSERECALENCREELSEVKGRCASFTVSKDQLTNQIFEQKTLIDRLEKQKDRFNKSKREENSVSFAVYNELKSKHEELTKKDENLQKLFNTKQVGVIHDS